MKRLATLAFAMLVLVALSPEPRAGTGARPSYDSFGSWLLACDNTLSCEAKGLLDTAPAGADLSIRRDAGPAGDITVRLAAAFAFEAKDLRIDNQPLRLDMDGWTLTREDGMATLSTGRPAVARAFIARIRNAGSIGFAGREDTVPLDGLTAALLRMDERQARLGTTTALVRRGTAPAGTVPPAPEPPVLRGEPARSPLAAAEEKRLLDTTRENQADSLKECSGRTELLEEDAWALDDDHALVLLPCLMGAYQGSSLAFIVGRPDGKAIEPFQPELPYGDGSHRADMLTEPAFDPGTARLTMAAKGRGLADCGISAEWVWTGGTFRLAALALQEACGGSAPGEWPVLYRSR